MKSFMFLMVLLGKSGVIFQPKNLEVGIIFKPSWLLMVLTFFFQLQGAKIEWWHIEAVKRCTSWEIWCRLDNLSKGMQEELCVGAGFFWKDDVQIPMRST